MQTKIWLMAAVMGVSLTACGGSSDEDVVGDYIEGLDEKYADEGQCIAEALTAEVGTNKMKKWAEKIREDGKIGTFDVSFLTNLSGAAKDCIER